MALSARRGPYPVSRVQSQSPATALRVRGERSPPHLVRPNAAVPKGVPSAAYGRTNAEAGVFIGYRLPMLLDIWAPSVLLPDVSSWWLDRARLSGSAFSFSAAAGLGTSPRLIGELLLQSGRTERPGGRTAQRAKARAGAPPFYGPVHRLLNVQTEVSPSVGYLTSVVIHQRPARM